MYNALIHFITGIIIAFTLYLGFEYLYGSSMSGLNPVLCICIIVATGIINICSTYPITSND